jgi:hypothetical protein
MSDLKTQPAINFTQLPPDYEPPDQMFKPDPRRKARKWLMINFVLLLMALSGLAGYFFGASSPCAKMESFDIHELETE